MHLNGRHPLLSRHLHQSPCADGEMVIDARRLVFAGPLDLAGMVALAHSARSAGKGVTLITADDQDITAYLQRMDVIRRMPPDTAIDGTLPAGRRAYLPHALLEVSPLAPDTADDAGTRLGRMAAHHFADTVAAKIFAAVGELIDNAVDHGASPEGAFVAAQVYTGTTSGRRGFEVAICDTGVGVLAHLRRNPAHSSLPDAARALERALHPGVTGTTDLRGNGLNDLLLHLEFGGLARFHLRSGDGLATVTVRGPRRISRLHRTMTPVTGTWAWLRIRIP